VNNVQNYKPVTGDFRRITNIVDSSNYNRFRTNIEFFERVLQGDFLVVGNGTSKDELSDYRPHNAFFRAMYRYGVILGICAIIFYGKILRQYLLKYFEIIMGLFAYYMVLNDFITGIELILITVFFIVIDSKILLYKERVAKRITNA
jgi:hypothetical protein